MKEVLLVGNPNSGKTTLFNSLTRSNEHVGNWHGVTVENKEKSFQVGNDTFVLVDTPGIYSLCPLSFEEEVATKTIFENLDKKIINICDQNNLGRNLYLTLCLLECGCDVVLAVNEIDRKPIFKIDYDKLSQQLGIEVVGINAEKKIGIEKLKSCLTHEKKYLKVPAYVKQLKNNFGNSLTTLNDFQMLKAFERDKKFFENHEKVKNINHLFENVPFDSVEMLAKMRYDFIDEVLASCAVRTKDVYGKSKLDKIALNKWLAFPVFLLILAGVFYLTFFSLGALLSDGLSAVLNFATSPILRFVENHFGQASPIYDLFNVAIFGGVGTVLSFLPQVVLLFFFLSVLEDSGYLSRIAFIFEDILGRIGLSGKSVYTLLMGFGCSTTAIMTARNMDDKNAKIKTAILCPYMSCSAKIPIYTVIGGAFFGASNIFAILGLYLLGVVVAISISKILESTVLKSKNQSFILEFPPYRITSPKRVGKILWKNVKEFLIRVGSVMIAMNVIIWILSSFSFSFAYIAGEGVSMLESIGKFIAPIFNPLGFGNWAIASSLLAGLVAKEVVVSSIAMFNGIDAGATKLISSSLLLSTSVVFFSTKASVISFLAFCLLYTPCIASISMLFQEIGKKWAFISIAIQLFVAYVVSFVLYQIFFAFEIFGFFKVFLVILSILLAISAFLFVFKRIKHKKLCTHCENCSNAKCGKRK